jgi:hypothetical protein
MNFGMRGILKNKKFPRIINAGDAGSSPAFFYLPGNPLNLCAVRTGGRILTVFRAAVNRIGEGRAGGLKQSENTRGRENRKQKLLNSEEYAIQGSVDKISGKPLE